MKILITGGTGMVGNSFKNVETEHDLIFVGSSQYDLTSRQETEKMIKEVSPEAVIHLAAKVGGVKGNTDFVNDFFTQNVLMNTNVLEVCHKHDVSRVISFLSTCVYPDEVTYPLTEEQIHNGPPHKSNFGYAYAKRMADIHSRTLRQQYGRNYICAIPNNLYGPNDNFDLDNGHVIPAIIRKVYEAKNMNKKPVFWGSGAPLREFTYCDDIANILMLLLRDYNDAEPINIGSTNEISIKDVVLLICDIMEYEGQVVWDTNKPEGQFRKPSSNKKFLQLFPNFKYTSFKKGLEQTCEWFKFHYPNVRGL
jgi:GDP-L-fucose synthase